MLCMELNSVLLFNFEIISEFLCQFEWLPVDKYVFFTVYITQDEAAFIQVIKKKLFYLNEYLKK